MYSFSTTILYSLIQLTIYFPPILQLQPLTLLPMLNPWDGITVRNVNVWHHPVAGTVLSVNAVYSYVIIIVCFWDVASDIAITDILWCSLHSYLLDLLMHLSIIPYTCGWLMHMYTVTS